MPEFDFKKFNKDELDGTLNFTGSRKSNFVTGAISYYKEILKNHDLNLSDFMWFCDNFQLLSESVKTRLTIENDDKASMYSVKDLMYIHEKIGIPIVFDYHHHKFNTGGLTEKEALKLAISTWPDSITPEVHYSESKALHENDNKVKPQAHSDYIKQLPELYGMTVDVMVEAKAKELAILPFIAQQNTCEYSGLLKVESYA